MRSVTMSASRPRLVSTHSMFRAAATAVVAAIATSEVTEVTVLQEKRRNEDERRTVRLVDARRAPTAAFGGQSNGTLFFVIFVA